MTETTGYGLFACPVCGQPLLWGEKSLRCRSGHCFDRAKEGYVNLLLPNRRNSQEPGDDKNMVNARSRFLGRGYYAPLREVLGALCREYAPQNARVLDLGCGEGYYTGGVADAVRQGGGGQAAGVDISRSAVRLAAKSAPLAQLAVASVFHLPVADGGADLLLNCFSPLCLPEILRVLRPGGHFLYVVPGARHLWGLKAALYRDPYQNEEKETPYQGLCYREIRRVAGELRLDSVQDIRDLFQMTPYFWKTSPEDQEKLKGLTSLETPIDFAIHVYRKAGGELE